MATDKPGIREQAMQADEASRAEAVRRENASLRAKNEGLSKEVERLRSQLNLIDRIQAGPIERPGWLLTPKKIRSKSHATLCLLITDTHFDEVVDPSQIHGLNAYNRPIAELRLRRCFEQAIQIARHYFAGITYDGVCLMLGGDIFSGNIHDELRRTNADTLFGSLLHWIGPVADGAGMLADEFKRVHVVAVPGNHGRMTVKPIAKQRAADNLDWLFYRVLQRELARETRVTWEIPNAADAHTQVYDVRYILTHGDQFRGGSGIAGAMSPLLLGAHRKTRREAAAGRPYDVMVMGHWHQEVWLPAQGVIVGNCLKGYDEFAFVSNFSPTPPAQQLWLTTPEYGITVSSPVFVQQRKQEGW